MTSQVTNRREGGSTSCSCRSRKLRTYTQKELETVQAAPELLGAPTIGGGSAQARGWWQRGCQKSNKPSKPPEIHENSEKTERFASVLAYKSPKTPIFAQKYLTRYTHKTFFEKYVNFQNHFLSHCGVIPVQSFGSHIRPQPHGLGLTPAKNAHYHIVPHQLGDEIAPAPSFVD